MRPDHRSIVAQKYAALIDQWNEADQAARDADLTLRDILDAFIRGEGPAPTSTQRDAVKTLRGEAEKRLGEVLRYVQRR